MVVSLTNRHDVAKAGRTVPLGSRSTKFSSTLRMTNCTVPLAVA